MSILRARTVGNATPDERLDTEDRPSLDGVPVREGDIEPVKGIRTVAVLFRGMALLLLLLTVFQIFFAVTSAVPLSPGVVMAEAVRLIIFAGLLWGAGDLGVLFVKSHYDLRTTRILTARIEYLLRQRGDSDDRLPTRTDGTPGGRKA